MTDIFRFRKRDIAMIFNNQAMNASRNIIFSIPKRTLDNITH
ncbi:Uncharacterised protein [Raoultella ornithinolytica]|nr:Uncharacterised protein [Raoultella ornithinolytica]